MGKRMQALADWWGSLLGPPEWESDPKVKLALEKYLDVSSHPHTQLFPSQVLDWARKSFEGTLTDWDRLDAKADQQRLAASGFLTVLVTATIAGNLGGPVFWVVALAGAFLLASLILAGSARKARDFSHALMPGDFISWARNHQIGEEGDKANGTLASSLAWAKARNVVIVKWKGKQLNRSNSCFALAAISLFVGLGLFAWFGKGEAPGGWATSRCASHLPAREAEVVEEEGPAPAVDPAGSGS